MLAILIAVVIGFCVLCVSVNLDGWKSFFVLLALPFILYKCCTSENYQQYDREHTAEVAAEWKAKTTPRPMSHTPDGCTVYVFTTDRDHYFTRCGNRVTTDTNYAKSCGKGCTKQQTETIVTEGNK